MQSHPLEIQRLVLRMQQELRQCSQYKAIAVAAINGHRVVFKCTKPGTTQTIAAVKAVRLDQNFPEVIEKRMSSDERNAKMEIKILNKILGTGEQTSCAGGRGNIVPIVETFRTKHFLFIVTPWVSGGDLLDYINVKRKMQQASAAADIDILGKWFAQICRSVALVHTSGFAHRDLSPENIMISEEDEYGQRTAMLHDFGLACPASRQHTSVGKLLYAAPEIFRRTSSYNPKAADIWGLGIVFFTMLTKHAPVNSSLPEEPLFQQYASNPALYVDNFLNDNELRHIMPYDAIDLFLKMAKVKPSERITIHEVLQHPYVRRYCEDGLELAPRRHSFPSQQLKNGVRRVKRTTSKFFRLSFTSAVL
jgi:serine/threonine protein kinase